MPIQFCLNEGVHPTRCAVSVPCASSRCELKCFFSIPRPKCFRAGFFCGKSLKRNSERGRNRTSNLLIKSQAVHYRPFSENPHSINNLQKPCAHREPPSKCLKRWPCLATYSHNYSHTSQSWQSEGRPLPAFPNNVRQICPCRLSAIMSLCVCRFVALQGW